MSGIELGAQETDACRVGAVCDWLRAHTVLVGSAVVYNASSTQYSDIGTVT
jgi:hypothetical protein